MILISKHLEENYLNVKCTDEFYVSKKHYSKYACTILDFSNKKIIDVFSSRRKNDLSKIFSSIPKVERELVKYISIDMWETYKDLARIYFYKAIVGIDSFHVIKHLNEAITSIRLKVMRKFDNKNSNLAKNHMNYYLLKKFHYFFTKDFDKIYSGKIKVSKLNTKWDKFEILKNLLDTDDDLKEAYYLKNRYIDFNNSRNNPNLELELDELIKEFNYSKYEEYISFGKLLSHWKKEILNSFTIINGKRLSSGPMEGINSKIKTILKVGNGYNNFNRFRNRIMYSINKDVSIDENPKRNK